MSALRRITRFASIDDLISVTFPTSNIEQETSQALRIATTPIVGADYGVDLLGNLSAPLDMARERLRATWFEGDGGSALDTDRDELGSKLRRIGRGKLWSVGADATERWAWARAASMPGITVTSKTLFTLPVVIEFVRLSDWYAATQTVTTEVTTATPHSFTVTTAGNVPVLNAIIQLQSSSAAGFTNPTLINLTTGETIASTRDAASVNDELRLDCGRFAAEYSTNNGAAYADDYALVTLGDKQVGFFTLQSGDNSLQYQDGGTPNFSIVISWYDPFG